VKPGEQVVTDGQLRLLDGFPVEVLKEATGSSAGKAPAPTPAPAPAKGRPDKPAGQGEGTPRS
jgi:hypothetical protein